MKLTKKEKKQMIEGKMKNISRELYNQELNIKIFESYGENIEVINATKINIEKQSKAYEALEIELEDVEQSEE